MKKLLALTTFMHMALGSASASAQSGGFGLERFEPTPAGEHSFWVDHPWYSKTRDFAAGLTFDYGHDPLVFGDRNGSTFSKDQAVIRHQLVGHVDLAASFLDRVTVSASLPVVFLERGTDVGGVAPNDAVTAGDPRPGLMLRIFGQPYQDPISLNVGADLWIPVGTKQDHAGDPNARVRPKVVLAGIQNWLLWAFSASFLFRSTESIGMAASDIGSTVGNELQLGGALAYADLKRGFSLGPEAVIGTVASHGFKQDFTSAEIMVGAHYQIINPVQVAVAGGFGLAREPGTPDARVIGRMVYAPLAIEEEPPPPPPPPPSDRDQDAIPDEVDACPDQKGPVNADARKNGCPDRDGDGVIDKDDQCPDEPMGEHPDPTKVGCPAKDRDGDRVYDHEDQCPDVAAGPHPDKNRPGCPDTDRDGDGVFDSEDRCPDEPSGLHPDPARPGCPLPDRDHDGVPDDVDACPDQPGAPSTDPKKNGCPGLVEIKGQKLVILQPVYFATNKDVILAKSFPVLNAVAEALKAEPEIRRIAVEGHTDSVGRPEYNLDLSQRRADSVMRWLSEHGIESERLEAHGYGMTRPVESNQTSAGRAANRRVEFTILNNAPPVVQ
jgi:outer membrane protein OmpA-like peptidoglycan-associated protein